MSQDLKHERQIWGCPENVYRIPPQGFYRSTKQKVIETLEGHYGFKRHLRDSYGTAVAFREGTENDEEGDRGGDWQERKSRAREERKIQVRNIGDPCC